MAALKTTRNDDSVERFLAAVDDDTRRADARQVCALMQRVTGDQPARWGDGIVVRRSVAHVREDQ